MKIGDRVKCHFPPIVFGSPLIELSEMKKVMARFKPGDEVIFPAMMFAATANAAVRGVLGK